MGKYPLETGNYVLILLGLVLVGLGPYITYRTVVDIQRRRKNKETLQLKQWASHGLNLLIAVLFLFAGVLFVCNNLRGNPLA
jgi:uncharacterized membrane protein YidH (DUF202 family)